MPHALIVEDEPEANKLLAMLVQLRGYRTESAFNGQEALAKIEHEPPDVVFLDLMLPDVNGYEICQSVKARKATTLIPVVMVTARVAVENRIQSYVLGADSYVAKTYTPEQIYQALDEAEDWRRNLDAYASHGAFVLGSRDEGETLRNLAKLRSLLLARTTLEADEVARLGGLLIGIAGEADNWGQKCGVSQVATFAYRTLDDHVELTVRDLNGWLSDDCEAPDERWASELDEARVDRVESYPSLGSITLIKHFPPR
jgi:DNA-binding response OmpR family regulator